MAHVIVSMSTLPNRIGFLEPTLRSLLCQRFDDYEIHLSLPRASWKGGSEHKWNIPSFVRDSRVVVKMVVDMGPITKLLPALEASDDDGMVVTADDDVIYPKRWLLGLYEQAQVFPQCVVGYRGIIFAKKPFAYSDVISIGDVRRDTHIRAPVYVDLVTGVFGVLYRKSIMDVCALSQLSECPDSYYNDDVWVCGLLAKAKIPRVCVPAKGRIRFQKDFEGVTKLWHINETAGHNDRIIEHFRRDWEADWAKMKGRPS